MNSVVRYILIYIVGLLTGVALTLAIIKFLEIDFQKNTNKFAESSGIEDLDSNSTKDLNEKRIKAKGVQDRAYDADTSDVYEGSDSLVYNVEADSLEDVTINHEKLVASRTFKIINLNADSTESNALRDSLERDLGIVKEKPKKSIKVEFWESPLNYEGYILGKNFVRLYGVNENESLTFYNLDNKMYMRKSDGTYVLVRSEEYHKFELSKGKVNDKILQISRNG